MVVASPFPANHGTPAGIREMAEAIAAKNHEVHVVTYHFGEGAPPKGVHIHRIIDLKFRRRVVVGPSYEKPLLDLLLLFKLVLVIVRRKIDLIHAHNYEGALVGYMARILTRRPLIYNAVNTMIDELPSYNFFKPKVVAFWLARFLDYWVPRMADRIISISEELALFLRGQGIRSERIHVVPLGVDSTHFDGRDRSVVRKQYQIGESRVVMYTGILDRFQRVDYLLQGMRIVVDQIHDAQLFIVANVAREEDIQACGSLIRELGLQDHVRIITHKSFEEIPLFLAAADVAVVPRPNCPGFPVKLLNYMAAGKAIVVFEGSSKGLQQMRQAILVKDHDWEALGRAIVSLLEDRGMAETLGRNAREWVTEHFSWSSLTRKIEDVYCEVLGRPYHAV